MLAIYMYYDKGAKTWRSCEIQTELTATQKKRLSEKNYIVDPKTNLAINNGFLFIDESKGFDIDSMRKMAVTHVAYMNSGITIRCKKCKSYFILPTSAVDWHELNKYPLPETCLRCQEKAASGSPIGRRIENFINSVN